MSQSRRLLTIDEVAGRLGQSRRTIQRKIATGELPAVQLGGKRSAIRIDERELEGWLYSSPEAPHDPPRASGDPAAVAAIYPTVARKSELLQRLVVTTVAAHH